MKKRCLLLFLLLLVVVGGAPPAEALLYTLNHSNAFGYWQGDIPPGYGYVEITEGENEAIVFTVGANPDYFSPADPGLTWGKFYFNLSGELGPENLQVESPGNWSLVEGRNVSGFGRFAFGLEGSAIGNAAVDPLRFRIEGSGLDLADFALANEDGFLFAGHLQRFAAIDGAESLYLAVGPAPVPEPATLLLLGAGLGGLALRRRRTAR